MTLENDGLCVEISRDAYHGSRFDNTGIITQVTLKTVARGEIVFCTQESLAPDEGNGGVGLANEFDIDGSESYDEARVGDPFLKIGVGWLKKPSDEPYSFFQDYEVLSRGELSESVTGNERISVWKSGVIGGFGCEYRKHIRICDNSIQVEYRLKNIGSKPLTTTEYAHNFIAAEQTGCRLVLSDESNGGFQLEGTFPYYTALSEERSGKLRSWSLRQPNNAEVSETVSFAPVKFAVWAMPHVVSCELFTRQRIAPGEGAAWQREYRFFMGQ